MLVCNVSVHNEEHIIQLRNEVWMGLISWAESALFLSWLTKPLSVRRRDVLVWMPAGSLGLRGRLQDCSLITATKFGEKANSCLQE